MRARAAVEDDDERALADLAGEQADAVQVEQAGYSSTASASATSFTAA